MVDVMKVDSRPATMEAVRNAAVEVGAVGAGLARNAEALLLAPLISESVGVVAAFVLMVGSEEAAMARPV